MTSAPDPPPVLLVVADARQLPLPDRTIDLVVTSPPYWKKRDYGLTHQIGQEPSPDAYVAALTDCLSEWRRVLTPTGSIFLNVADTYRNRSLARIPGRVETAAQNAGWLLRNRIIWSKPRGMPDPAKNRLVARHEYVLHLTRTTYHYDLFGYAAQYGRGANPGDVWPIPLERTRGPHLVPFPLDLARRAIILGCPRRVCRTCGHASRRLVTRTADLDTARPQARRALQLAAEAGLTPEHIAAIQATGISDAGKAVRLQTGRNSPAVRRLAAEAKAALGGYFREFTFARRESSGWSDCGHGSTRPGRVLDPFSGTGTTCAAAAEDGLHAVGADLDASCHVLAAQRHKDW